MDSSPTLSISNPHPKRMSGPSLLHDLVQPPSDATALEHLENGSITSLSYHDLHQKAEALARRISQCRSQSKDTGARFVVPLLIRQSPLLYISQLAILKAGGAFCPLNIDAPPERVKFILEDVSASVALASEELAEKIQRTPKTTVIVVDDESIDSEDQYDTMDSKLHRKPSPDDPAYIMYTSGSTGTPKGVTISHDAATQALLAHDHLIPNFSRFLQFAAPTFDVSVFEIFFPLFRGATLIGARREDMLDDLPKVLRDMRVDACELTPSVAGSLLRKRENAPGLKLLLTIGEMLNAAVVREFGGSDEKESMLWAMYGPTEATIHCTLQTALRADSPPSNIGVPLDTVSAFIIEPSSPESSSNFRILPQGEVGELAVGGHQLASNYLNRPDQTAAAFIDSPYGTVYRTGDKARMRQDGTLECLGRLSEGQVKLRGQRLELGEVESAAMRCAGCHGAVAAVIKSILVIFCATEDDVTTEIVIQTCEDWLPRYMVPGEVGLMKDFPRLPSGKIDRKTLKSDFEEQKMTDSIMDADEGDLGIEDVAVLEILSELMGCEVDKRSSLAALGVNSLKAIQLASTLRSAGFNIHAAQILSLTTVGDLGSTLQHQPTATTKLDSVNVSLTSLMSHIIAQHPSLRPMQDLVEDVLLCTPLQSAMLAETMRDHTLYMSEVSIELAKDVTAKATMAAFEKTIADNGILRTGYVQWEDDFAAVLYKGVTPKQVELVDTFEPSVDVESIEGVAPFKVQIEAEPRGQGRRVLIRSHHAAFDGWSLDMILSDVTDHLRGKQPDLRHSFKEVVKYYRGGISQEDEDAARYFWSEHLLGWTNTRWPTLLSRVPTENHVLTTTQSFDLLPRHAENKAREVGSTPQAIFQAALALVWSKILGAQNIVLGSVTSGRSIPVQGIESILGPCIASMPLRINLEKMSTNLDVLNSIKSSNRAIMQHSTLPLAEIKKLAGLQGRDTLYDVLFVYQESLASKDRDSLMLRETSHLDRLETRLVIEVEPTDSGFNVQGTYHSDAIPSEFVSHLLDQLVDVARSILDQPHGSTSSLFGNLSSSLSIYNPKPLLYSEEVNLAKLFENSVRRDHEANALCFAKPSSSGDLDRQVLTYEDLNVLANQVARYILSQGVRTGDLVAIVTEKSVLFYASVLGIVKAGCGYLPVLPSTPAARVQTVFQQANVKHCVVDEMNPEFLNTVGDVKAFRVTHDKIRTFPGHNLDLEVDEDQLAYVIYTSGTTGVPKGVAVTQRNIVANVTYLESIYPRSKSRNNSKLLQACSQAFDVSVFEIFYTWCAGMCLCAATHDTVFQDIEQIVRELDITHLSLTPTVASLIDPRNVPNVEFLVTAGESMAQTVLDKWGDLLWQGYGPSETTNICSVKHMRRGETIQHLGWVFPNTAVYVLLPSSVDVLPLGWVGEFCFGGDQVAAGYLNMPDRTEVKFLNHPELGRLYRSGDIGRMLPDGSLMVVGRLDDQVKLRGQRIEATEINSIITATGLASAVVTMILQHNGEKRNTLVAFFAPDASDDQDFETLDVGTEINHQIFASLQSSLPGYMVPAFLIPVSRIPHTPSGKVDRERLGKCFDSIPRSYLEASSGQGEEQMDDAEWTDTEKTLAKVLSRRFNVRGTDIGRWTPFASLGVDSISAIGLARDLTTELGQTVAISTILQSPTIAQLGKAIPKLETTTSKGSGKLFSDDFISKIKAEFATESKEVVDVLPCTPLQEAMLLRGQRSYYNRILLRLNVPAEEMQGYWDEMVRRHGILRTCFVTTSNAERPMAQVILRNSKVKWKSYEVTESSLEGAIHGHLATLPEPLDSRQPPLSFALIHYRGTAFLSFICHHALYDGVAMESLWREVEALANGVQLDLPVPYQPFLSEMVNLPSDCDDFWRSHFRGFQPSHLFGQMKWKQLNQLKRSKSLDMPYDTLQMHLRSLGISLLSLCQAAWANTLAIASDLDDVCFGNVMSGRTLGVDGIERLVAPCFNTLPIRRKISQDIQNIDLVKDFHRLNSQLLRYQFTPLRRVQKLVKQQQNGLFETLLLLQQPLRDMDEKVWTLEEDTGDMDVPLVCEVVPCPGLRSVLVNVYYDINLVPDNVAMGTLDIFGHLLVDMVRSPFAGLTVRNTLRSDLSSALGTVKARLAKPEDDNHSISSKETWSELETTIQHILSQLSGMDTQRIRRDMTIFQLGLDSINAVQVASMVRKEGHQLSTSDVVECLCCRKMAERIRENAYTPAPKAFRYNLATFSKDVSHQATKAMGDAAMTDVEAVLPSTPLQAAMLSSFLQSRGQNYLNELVFEFDSDLASENIERSWRNLCRVHPLLRTGFVPIQHQDASYAMVRYRPDSAPGTAKVKHYPTQETTTWKEEVRKEMLSQISKPPCAIALCVREEKTRLHLVIHHALYDANSLSCLLDCFSEMLQGKEVTHISSIEPGLSSIMTRSTSPAADKQAKVFWESHAANAVINKFPVMTPLREDNPKLLTHEASFSTSSPDMKNAVEELGCSMQAILQAAWTRVLAAYLGEENVVFGVTLSGRNDEDTRQSPMPCLTTIPVVASNLQSNAELLLAMTEFNKGMHKHQYSPLSKLQKWLGHPGSPVFDTLLVYQRNETREQASRPWTQLEDNAVVDYPVSLEVETHKDTINVRITFSTDILPQEQAKLLVEQFTAWARNLMKYPSGNRDGLHLRHRSLYSIQSAAQPEIYSPVSMLHHFVEARALSHPDAPALKFVSGFKSNVPVTQTWTYAELDKMGNKVAHLLQPHAPAGSIVAIHFDKCPEAYFSILGILKAGCSFVALDPMAPKSRKEFIMRDSRAPCLLVKELDDVSFDIDGRILAVNETTLSSCSSGPLELADQVSTQNTCYCLYTSGTTGTPKGCEITHENAVQAMMAFQELFKGHYSTDSRWLQFASLHFDVSVLEQYWSWSVGMTVVAATKDLILDDLTGFMSCLDITHIDLTPSLARLTHPDDVPSLCRGVFITGGEQLKQEILDVWGPKAVIYNAYGPTEATIGVTMYQRVPVNGRPSNIGPQFPNVGSYVLRPGTEIPVLRGGAGELCVTGKLVGKGYLNRPELTGERFPVLGAEFGQRVYRTGDLVRLLHDGCFDFLGRIDDQVKLRGQRLEIEEINHTIRAAGGNIQDVATVVARHGSSGKDVLVSFLVGADEVQERQVLKILDDEEGLGLSARAACQDHLPGYMVPTYFLKISHIPLSANNKAEVKELRQLFGQLSHEQLLSLTPKTKTTTSSTQKAQLESLIRVVGEFSTTSQDDISEETSIFDLGVDSISALQLASLLKTRGFPSATPAVIMRHPIIADLLQSLSSNDQRSTEGLVQGSKQTTRAFHHRNMGHACRELKTQVSDVDYIAPCTPLQEGMISRAATEDGTGLYFNSFELRLGTGPTPEVIDRVKAAWQSLIDMHSILRTCFIRGARGDHVQVALRNVILPFEAFTSSTEPEKAEILQRKRQQWIMANQDNIVNPLRLCPVTCGHVTSLTVFIFHGNYDGISFDIMMEQLAMLYHNKQPDPGPAYLDCLHHGPLWKHDSSKSFWQQHLRGWQPNALAGLSSSSAEIRPRAVIKVIRIDDVEALRKSCNVTLQSVMLALWTSTLQENLATPLTTGIILSGRSISFPGAEKVVGPLFNTLPFFRHPHHSRTWQAAIKTAYDFAMETLSFQHAPLRDLQKWCAKGQPLFDNLFAFQIEKKKPVSSDQVPWEVLDGPLNADYPLAFEATATSDGQMKLLLVAQGHVADNQSLEELLDKLVDNVSTAARDPDGVIGTISADDGQTSGRLTSSEPIEINTGTSSQFVWTQDAEVVRKEVSLLAGTSPNALNESTTVLELGLDSIDVVRLSANLKRHGLRVTPSIIMRQKTIANIARSITSESQEQNSSEPSQSRLLDLQVQIKAQLQRQEFDLTAAEAVFPPTALQEAMVAGMLQSDFEWYFNHDVLQINQGVDLDRFEKAWAEVTKNSPILRTGFVEMEDSQLDMAYCQVVYKQQGPVIKRSRAYDRAQIKHLQDNAITKAKAGHGRKDLFQLQIVEIEDECFLVLSISHALYDGWSLPLLYADLEVAYHGSLRSRQSPELFLSKAMVSASERAENFWQDYLRGVQPSLLPERRKFTTEPVSSLNRAESKSTVSLQSILACCKSHSISLQVLCQACWAVVLGRRTKSLEVTLGVVLSGRDFDGAEDLLFPTINTIAVRSILHGSATSFLGYLEESMSDIREFQGFPLRKTQVLAAKGQLFNSLFMLQKAPGAATEQSLLTSVGGSASLDYPVSVEAEASGEDLIWRVACQDAFFSEGEARGLVDELDTVLQCLINHGESDVLRFDGTSVSFCGLQAVELDSNSVESVAKTPQENGEEVQLDPVGLAIRDVLGRISGIPPEDISPWSTLYHLGLDSISAIKVSSSLRKRDISLKPRDLLAASSILEMATIAQSNAQQADVKPDADIIWNLPSDIDVRNVLADEDIEQNDIEALLPATAAQVYMVSTWENTQGAVFFPDFRYRLHGVSSSAKVQDAWNQLVDQLPILRTRIFATGSRTTPFIQIILNKGANQAFSKTSLALLDVSEYENGYILLKLKVHHALYDAFNLANIMELLSSILKNGCLHFNSSTSAWASFCTQPTLEANIQARRDFWTRYLSGCSNLKPLFGTPNSKTMERVSCFQPSALSNANDLRQKAAKRGVSVQTLFFAAYARIVSARSQETTVVIGVYLANRDEVNAEDELQTYPTLNLVPLRIDVPKERSLVDVAKAIQEDIHQIGLDVRAQTGLWEIEAWTRVKVDTFINFLRPDLDTDAVVDNGMSVTITPETLARDNASTGSGLGAGEPWQRPWKAQQNAVRDAFPASVDIEAAIQGSALDVGVFGPRSLISAEEAEDMIRAVVQHLDEVSTA